MLRSCRMLALFAVMLANSLPATAWSCDACAAATHTAPAGASLIQQVNYLSIGQGRWSARCRCPQCMAGSAPATTEPAPATAPASPPNDTQTRDLLQPEAAPDFNMLSSSYGAARGPESVGVNMLGDFLVGGALSGSNLVLSTPTVTPSTGLFQVRLGANGQPAPATFSGHSFKIADNESPWPRTRLFVTSNYFDQVGGKTGITREMFGFEQQLGDGSASISMRLPLYSVAPGVQNNAAFVGGQIGTFGVGTEGRTSLGDLTTVFKQALIYDPSGGNVLSWGTALVAPTGPATIGGVTPAFTLDGVQHTGSIQPFLAGYKSLSGANSGWFVQGFFAVDTPFTTTDATYLFNDWGVGYIHRTQGNWLTAIVPTMEVHVANPLNNRTHTARATPALIAATGYNLLTGSAYYFDQVNITSGVTCVLNHRSTLSLGVCAPVAQPHPYNYELQILFNTFVGSWVAPLFQ